VFEIEWATNGQSAERRKATREEFNAPLVADLQVWMCEQRAELSSGNEVAKAMDYMLKRWSAFTRFLRRRLYLTVQQCSEAWGIKLISNPKYE
jgi:transposase